VSKQLAKLHIEAEARLRAGTVDAVKRAWAAMPAYNRENLDEWLSIVLPIVEAAQRQSVSITDAYIAMAVDKSAFGVNYDDVTGAAVRNGTPPETVYERPFVTVWAALGNGQEMKDALSAGLARATTAAAMDTQLAMRATADKLQSSANGIYGYQRVADAGACEFCQAVDGAYVKGSSGFVMALHPECGCGLEVLTEPHRGAVRLPDGTKIRAYQHGPLTKDVAVHDHGELGPLLGSPDHNFDSL